MAVEVPNFTPEAFARFEYLLNALASRHNDNDQAPNRALRAALFETVKRIKYLEDHPEEEAKIGTTVKDEQIARLWQEAANSIGYTDPDLALACTEKGLGWANPKEWEIARRKGIPIDIEDMKSALARLEAGVSKKSDAGGAVFISHGHSQSWLSLRRLLNMIGILCLEFNEVSPAGVPTDQRLQEMLDSATLAFIVATGELKVDDGSTQPRMNVIDELGRCRVKLGSGKTIVLLEEGCALPSNYAGINYIKFPKDSIEAASEEIKQVLVREGIIPSATRIGRRTM